MKERLKTICIVILLITGISQVGILWSYQNRGTPTGFIYGLFGLDQITQISDEILRERLFLPDRLVLSDGSGSYWVVADTGNRYSALWDEVKRGLYRIVSGEVGLTKAGGSWGEAMAKRGILIDFGYDMDAELLSWFLGIVDPSLDVAKVRKVMINRDITDESMSTFYIYSSDGTVYSSRRIRNEAAVKLEDSIAAVSQTSRGYTSLKGGGIAKDNDEPDVLYAVAPKYWRYSSYSMAPPAKIENDEELADILLGTETDRYNRSRIRGNILQFNYGDNVYRYYEDGYMTYRYLEAADTSGKGRAEKALLNAYQFIAEIYDKFETPADIVLTTVEKLPGGIYRFGFDYKVAGMPVKIDVESKDGSGTKEGSGTKDGGGTTKDGPGARLEYAIEIQADMKRVLKCDWLLRKFERSGSGNYDDRFNYLLENSGMSFRDISIRDIYPCYYINLPLAEQLRPALLIKTKDQGNISVDMIPEEGD
jgi:hypothetical protein